MFMREGRELSAKGGVERQDKPSSCIKGLMREGGYDEKYP
jgi:hypothetical protein